MSRLGPEGKTRSVGPWRVRTRMASIPDINRTPTTFWPAEEDSRLATFWHLQDEWLLRNGLSFRSRALSITRPPMRAHLLEVGAGEPVLLVHGGGGFAALWAPLLRSLPEIRALAIDRPGFWLSDGFDYGGVDLRRHAVDFLSSALDTLGLH